jgi:SAM-dependent methyltransferase
MRHGRGHDILSAVFFGGRRKRVFTELAALSGARPGDRVLDVGSGTGYFTRVMARAVGPDGAAEGVDPSPEGVTRARRVTHLANCTFSEGVAEALDSPAAAYDVVVSSLVIHHLPEELRPQAFQEMLRVLRPGGRVLVADVRPPATALGRLLMGRHSPSMRNNPGRLRAGGGRRGPPLDPLRPGREANRRRMSGAARKRASGTPRWVKVFGAIALVVVLLLVILMLTGGSGGHGPGRHGGAGHTAPPSVSG